jgi:hypothetical protein
MALPWHLVPLHNIHPSIDTASGAQESNFARPTERLYFSRHPLRQNLLTQLHFLLYQRITWPPLRIRITTPCCRPRGRHRLATRPPHDPDPYNSKANRATLFRHSGTTYWFVPSTPRGRVLLIQQERPLRYMTNGGCTMTIATPSQSLHAITELKTTGVICSPPFPTHTLSKPETKSRRKDSIPGHSYLHDPPRSYRPQVQLQKITHSADTSLGARQPTIASHPTPSLIQRPRRQDLATMFHAPPCLHIRAYLRSFATSRPSSTAFLGSTTATQITQRYMTTMPLDYIRLSSFIAQYFSRTRIYAFPQATDL